MDFPKMWEKNRFWSSARCRRSCAMKLSEIRDEIWPKHKKSKFSKKFDFFEKISDDIFRNQKFSKRVTLFFNRKRKSLFWKMSTFKNVIAKIFEKIELFFDIFQFFMFYHISSPISESFIPQLFLLCALDKKVIFSSIFPISVD